MSKKLSAGQGWSFEPADKKQPSNTISLPISEQKLFISCEKRNKGKIVTVISGFQLSTSDLKNLTKQLKNFCGSGGSYQTNVIEIQGDHKDKLLLWFKNNQWSVR